MKNYSKVYNTFQKHYKLVPLEVFSADPYKVLISTLLSSRTNDDTTLKAALRLFRITPDVTTLSKLSVENINKLIYPVGFHKTKSLQLNKLSRLILTNYDGIIPNTRSELMSLPGVGRKTANLTLNRAFGVPAIAVDTHVHRITNMLGWANADSPEKTELQLIKVLPKKYWSDTNRLFVSIGRQYRSQRQLINFLKENNLIN